mmetsp:Transcript_93185/g.164830  ORF Transcript_93185/g.164830 Transcript_93185/m.164830 type:complete len:127 (+) Transcript_93185:65-445(+)
MMMKCSLLVVMAAMANAASPSLLSKVRKNGACQAELRREAPKGSAAEACAACKEFRDGHKASQFVAPNTPLCTQCYSVTSACDTNKFAWTCYDITEQITVMNKSGMEVAEDMADAGFIHKAFAACS